MLIKIQDVTKSFCEDDSLFFKVKTPVLNGVSLEIHSGECIGIVGESGSGKSTLGKLILGIETPDSGTISLSSEMQKLPRHEAMSVVFQDYNTSVNPRWTIAQIVAEPLIHTNMREVEKRNLVETLLDEVGLSSDMLDRFPHQLSGGQLQRVNIARAIAPNPRFILLDEAVSSLDVSVQVQILDLLLELKERRNISYLFITHDITVASYMCDRLIFFKDGLIVEEIADLNNIGSIQDPYTLKLLDAASYLEQTDGD